MTSHSGANAPGFLSLPLKSMRNGFRTLITIVTVTLMLVGGLAFMPAAASADAGNGETSQTTDSLKLRENPSLNAGILTVIPAGGTVSITGGPENGFYPVVWQGQAGYAYGDYLSGLGSDGGSVTTGGQQGEVHVADGPVNFRTGPSTSDTVISVIPDDALVALNGDSANGFVAIVYTDQSGWAHSASVFGNGEEAPAEEPTVPEEPVDEEPAPEEPAPTEEPSTVPVGDTMTGSATVVDGRLNLRTGPSTDYTVITVMPDGSTVELRGEPQGGFHPLSFGGTTGWASGEWLQLAGEEPVEPAPTEEPTEPEPTEPVETEEPTAPPVDGGDGYSEDEIIQIINNAAAEYDQPADDMLRVARCESVLDPNAVNSSSNASGLFQFLPSTWATTPYAEQDIFDPVANANAAAWMWANGRRNEWVCQ